MMAMDEDELDLDSVKKSLSQLNKAESLEGTGGKSRWEGFLASHTIDGCTSWDVWNLVKSMGYLPDQLVSRISEPSAVGWPNVEEKSLRDSNGVFSVPGSFIYFHWLMALQTSSNHLTWMAQRRERIASHVWSFGSWQLSLLQKRRWAKF